MRMLRVAEQGIPLIEPLSALRREQLSQQLNAACASLRQQLHHGRPRPEFAALQKLLGAVEVAQGILAEQGG
jgi:type II secretory pathway component PulF